MVLQLVPNGIPPYAKGKQEAVPSIIKEDTGRLKIYRKAMSKMITDMLGTKRLKVNLHLHTTRSDGRKTPEEAAAIYKAAGYDLIAVTDHWEYLPSGEIGGLRVLSGGEFNVGGGDAAQGVYHILGLGCSSALENVDKNSTPQAVIDEIRRRGGLAVLAHPAWSLNTVDQLLALRGIEATEIYNTVSDVGESSRPYSGHFADAAACKGLLLPLLADDDTHFYQGEDETTSCIMLDCPQNATDQQLLEAIRQKRFYATQGPEIHLLREGDRITVKCSPAVRISFFSNTVWAKNRCVKGKNLTEASCTVAPFETFIRAEVTDADGKKAWSNPIALQ